MCLLGQGLNDSPAVNPVLNAPSGEPPVAPGLRSQQDAAYAVTTPSRRLNQQLLIDELRNLFPQLEILEPIGQGGMGSVYKARQTKLDRIVAVKVIRPEVSEDPAFAERFMREARTLARLQHPNIIGVHDFGEIELRPATSSTAAVTVCYFVMEYIDGANVRQLMQSKALNQQLIYSIMDQTCDALQYAHDQGVVHRDIKPENLLVDARGRVKIADFGLAKLADGSVDDYTLTGTHQVMGTPSYMAPEQIMKSRDVDHRADIYSLGVVLYEMLTGSIPLGRFAPASSKAGSDLRLDDVIHQALATEPDQRFANISLFRRKLSAIVDRQPVTSSPGVEPAVSAAHGLSTILDREVAGVWRMVGGTPAAESGRRNVVPMLSMLALCIAGAATLLSPWFDLGNMPALELPAPGEESVAALSSGLNSLRGYDLVTGRMFGAVLAALALFLCISSDRSRSSIFSAGGCSILAFTALLLCFAAYSEAQKKIIEDSSVSNSSDEPGFVPDQSPSVAAPQPVNVLKHAGEFVFCQDAEQPVSVETMPASMAVFNVRRVFFLTCGIAACIFVFSLGMLRQSFLYDLSPQGDTAQGADVVTVKLSQLPQLPEVCAVCGEHGELHVHRKLNFQPPWAQALSLAGFILGGLPGVFILMLTSQETPVTIPVCQRHRHHGRRLVLFASMGWIIPILTAALAVIIIYYSVEAGETSAVGIPIGAGLGLIFYILPIIYLNVTSVKCEQTSEDTVTMSRVSSRFWKAAKESLQLR